MIANDGIKALIERICNSSSDNCKVRLFINDITPVATTTADDFSNPGNTYTPNNVQNLRDFTWPAPTINGSGQAESDGPEITWTCSSFTSPETIYGLYVTIWDSTSTQWLLFAARFATPVTISASGDSITKKINWFTADLGL